MIEGNRRESEYEACREEVFGYRAEEIVSSSDDEDPNMRAARLESMRTQFKDEERRMMQYEAGVRGNTYETGDSSSGAGFFMMCV